MKKGIVLGTGAVFAALVLWSRALPGPAGTRHVAGRSEPSATGPELPRTLPDPTANLGDRRERLETQLRMALDQKQTLFPPQEWSQEDLEYVCDRLKSDRFRRPR